MIRLAIAAPSAMLLAGLEAMLGDDGSHVVVERAARLEELAEQLEGAEVDVVVAVVDDAAGFRIPRVDDVGGGTAPPRHPVVILADTHDGSLSTGEWLRRGARAVIPREAEPREIHAAIAAVAAGLVVVSAGDVAELQGDARRGASRLTSAAPPPLAPISPLSPREREILGLMAEGLVNKLIAARLGISEHTVKTHVASIFSKLDVETRAEAVAVGARSGVILL